MKTEYPEIYRRRFIPNELIHLKNDDIISYEPGKLLLTHWKAINARPDFAEGYSAYFVDKGVKVSKMLRDDGSLNRWYCDIVECLEEPDKFTCVDLLFDVIEMPNGCLKVVDIGEAADAFETGLITKDQLLRGMRTTDLFLADIYKGTFSEMKKLVEEAEKTFKSNR